MNKNVSAGIVIGIMCFLLTFGIVVQISSVEKETTILAKRNTENELRGQVIELNQKNKKNTNLLKKAEKKLDRLRDNVIQNNELSGNEKKELEKITKCLGLTALSGPGITIELYQGDLLKIINALNNAGAEAISINDNRLVFNTKIKMEGDILSIDGEVVKTPYVIKAIGQNAIYSAVTMPDSYLDKLKKQDYDIKITKSDNLKIEKYKGIYKFDFAEIE